MNSVTPTPTSTPLAVQIEGLAKAYGTKLALVPSDLQIHPGEFLAVLGPSGCGKSTLLRLLAGLIPPDAGHIVLQGRDITRDPPEKRDIALVFQLFTAYPHLSVLDNATFSLRAQGMDAAQAESQAQAWLKRFEIGHLAKQKPRGLAYSERQRIAMTRALVRQAGLYLFDEPLTALERGAREAIWHIVRRELKTRKTAALLVTHDQQEAMAMGDRVAVMHEGRIEQCAPPRTLYEKPANAFVAGFVGNPAMNLLTGRRQGDWVVLNHLPIRIRVGEGSTPRKAAPAGEKPCTVGIRPEWVAITETGAPVQVEHSACLGAAHLLELRAPGASLRAWLPIGVRARPQETLRVQFMPSGCLFFDGAHGEILPWRALEVQCLPGN